jgi:hypothetical protein
LDLPKPICLKDFIVIAVIIAALVGVHVLIAEKLYIFWEWLFSKFNKGSGGLLSILLMEMTVLGILYIIIFGGIEILAFFHLVPSSQ